MSLNNTSKSWVICPRPNEGARLRLFCFPYAGGGAATFRPWPNRLPPDVELCAVQPPGREMRLKETPFTQLAPLVEALADVIQPYGDKPFAFFGHSLGGLVAFELTRQLQQQKRPTPVCLLVSAVHAPHRPNRKPPIHHLPEADFVAGLKGYNGTPEAVLQHEELFQLLLPLLRADFSVYETYRYTAGLPIDCPITVFGGLADEMVPHEDLAAWRDHTRRTFKQRMLSGDHFFLHSQQKLFLQALSEELVTVLSQAR